MAKEAHGNSARYKNGKRPAPKQYGGSSSTTKGTSKVTFQGRDSAFKHKTNSDKRLKTSASAITARARLDPDGKFKGKKFSEDRWNAAHAYHGHPQPTDASLASAAPTSDQQIADAVHAAVRVNAFCAVHIESEPSPQGAASPTKVDDKSLKITFDEDDFDTKDMQIDSACNMSKLDIDADDEKSDDDDSEEDLVTIYERKLLREQQLEMEADMQEELDYKLYMRRQQQLQMKADMQEELDADKSEDDQQKEPVDDKLEEPAKDDSKDADDSQEPWWILDPEKLHGEIETLRFIIVNYVAEKSLYQNPAAELSNDAYLHYIETTGQQVHDIEFQFDSLLDRTPQPAHRWQLIDLIEHNLIQNFDADPAAIYVDYYDDVTDTWLHRLHISLSEADRSGSQR